MSEEKQEDKAPVQEEYEEKCFVVLSLKTQFFIIFVSVVLVAGGVTLAICLGMVRGLGLTAYSSAQTVILRNTRSNSANLGIEIASLINIQLEEISQSVCKTSSLYSKALLQYAEENIANGTLLEPQLSYKEFEFSAGCREPFCPSDYGSIYTRSRIPYIPGYLNGSMAHSSVFLFSKGQNMALRNLSVWNEALAEHPSLSTIINGLAYQDSDFEEMYQVGPNTTVMFYLSAALHPQNTATVSHIVHRTYPGIEKNQSTYDPSTRPWFTRAPEDGVHIYGPYVESFTKQIVVTLSSKKTTVLKNGDGVEIVAAAGLLIQDVAQIVSSVQYSEGGYGALITYQTNNIVVWKNITDVYDQVNKRFLTVADVDPELAKHDLSSNKVFDYADSSGKKWIVTTRSLFASDDTSQPSLVVLVFSDKRLAEEPLRALNVHISTTTDTVTINSLIVVLVTMGFVLGLVLFLVWYITKPIETIRQIASDVVKVTTEDDDSKDFQSLLDRAYSNLTRSDEIGILCANFYNVICILDSKLQQKRNTPTYPKNPLFGVFTGLKSTMDERAISWSTVGELYMQLRQPPQENPPTSSSSTAGAAAANSTSSIKVSPQQSTDDAELDVLASMMPTFQLKAPVVETAKKTKVLAEEAATVPAIPLRPPPRNPYAQVAVSDLEGSSSTATAAAAANASSVYVPVEQGDIEMQNLPVATRKEFDGRSQVSSTTTHSVVAAKKLDWCTSLRSQLYLLNALLVAGMILALVLTVIWVDREGSTWMDSSTTDLETVQIQNLVSLSNVKKVFVQTYFEQLSLELFVGANVFKQILGEELNRPNYIPAQMYLPSYSIDGANPYYGGSVSTYAYSGYFSPNDAGCAQTGSCGIVQTSNQTRLTSLFDMKLKSFYYAGNSLSFLQLATQRNGYTRYMPYTSNSQNAAPTSCLISPASLNSPYCYQRYMSSKCGDPLQTNYPVYDPRCRSWYTQAVIREDSSASITSTSNRTIVFQYPRISSSGKFVLTASTPVFDAVNQSLAVLNSNVLVTTLSASINELRVLKSGYCYLVDALNATYLVLHPHASTSCTRVSCAEGFANEAEYSVFASTVLTAVEDTAATAIRNPVGGNGGRDALRNVSLNYTYRKHGALWQLIVSYVVVPQSSATYALLMTVPQSEVLEAATKTQDAIDGSVTDMIIAFACIFAFFVVVLFFVTRHLIQVVIHPLDDIRAIFQRVVAHSDYSSQSLPSTASSLDMRTLLDAVSQLLVALRFGSEMHARGNSKEAEHVFLEALAVFRTTHNLRGMGASLNNLGAVYLSRGDFEKAERMYREAIAAGQELLVSLQHKQAAHHREDSSTSISNNTADTTVGSAGSAAHDPHRKRNNSRTVVTAAEQQEEQQRILYERQIVKLKHTISDRQGNLAALFIEKGDFPTAYAMLESLLLADKEQNYVRGCIVKQGTLGQYYLRQGEVKSAQRIFDSASAYISGLLEILQQQEIDNNDMHDAHHHHPPPPGALLLSNGLELDDVYAAQQMALYNQSLVSVAKLNALTSKQETQDPALLPTLYEDIEAGFVKALCATPVWHLGTTKKIVIGMDDAFARQSSSNSNKGSKNSIRSPPVTKPATTVAAAAISAGEKNRLLLKDILELLDIPLFDAGHSGNHAAGSSNGVQTHSTMRTYATKQVFFAIDISGSMSGTKIRSARDNLLKILEEHVSDDDSLMIVTFNHVIRSIVPVQLKKSKPMTAWTNQITDALATPSGSTVLYDAVHHLLQEAEKISSSKNTQLQQWMIVLTDGEDNGSKISLSALVEKLTAADSQQNQNFASSSSSSSALGIIVLGIGKDVSESILQQISGAMKNGKLILAEGNQKSISDAFGRVAKIIQGDILMEDY